MAQFLLHINYGGLYGLYFGVGRKHLKYYLFRHRFMMPFISLLYRKDFDSSDVVALILLFVVVFEVLCYEMLDIWIGISYQHSD